MKHYASAAFWGLYDNLPKRTQQLADKNFELLKQNPRHPSLHFKQIEEFYSARIGLQYRTLGVAVEDGVLWFWIGDHNAYDRMIQKR